MPSNTAFTTDNTIENNKAIQKPSTEKTRYDLCAARIISALMTSRKSPRVTTVIGMVSSTRIGLTIAFERRGRPPQ